MRVGCLFFVNSYQVGIKYVMIGTVEVLGYPPFEGSGYVGRPVLYAEVCRTVCLNY